MKNAEIGYETALEYARSNFPEVRIVEDFKHQDKKGLYIPELKLITIYERTSHTVLHEIGHHITVDIFKIAKNLKKEYAFNEVLAEMTSYSLLL